MAYLPGSPVYGIFQTRIAESIAMSSSRGSSWPRDRTWVSYISCIGRWILHHESHLEPACLLLNHVSNIIILFHCQHHLSNSRLLWYGLSFFLYKHTMVTLKHVRPFKPYSVSLVVAIVHVLSHLLILCNPMDYSMPGFTVLHCLLVLFSSVTQ